MIKNIIFDFGDIFINLDKEIVIRELEKRTGSGITPDLLELGLKYEVGAITSENFIEGLQMVFPKTTSKDITDIWNGMLLDFPEYRLEFLEALAKENKYKLILLSNTNELHILEVVRKMGEKKYERFKSSFDKFYLSHEINLRKPNADIYHYVLNENKLRAEETLFIDDTKENTESAKELGITTWNLLVGKEDIIELNSKL